MSWAPNTETGQSNKAMARQRIQIRSATQLNFSVSIPLVEGNSQKDAHARMVAACVGLGGRRELIMTILLLYGTSLKPWM
jgi:hypothetical protein